MPYTVTITPDEAERLNEAQVEGVTGGIFEYEPRDTMKILGALDATAAVDAPGLDRIRDRLATLYGQAINAHKVATAEVIIDQPFAEAAEVVALPSPDVEEVQTLEVKPKRRA